jgi:hypothetical protein
MKFNSFEKTITLASAYSIAGQAIDVGFYGGDSISMSISADVDTPSNKTFAAAAVTVNPANTITISAHGYTAGLKVQISNPGTLPTGITASTDYFVIVVDADTIKLASSLINALAGTAVSITNIGSGTNTVNVTALAGASVKLQQSNDNINWSDISGTSTSITVDSVLFLEKDRPTYRYARQYLTLTAGHVSLSSAVLVKGDKA